MGEQTQAAGFDAEERVLQARITSLRGQRASVAEEIVRGLASRDALTALAQQVQQAEAELEDVRALQKVAASHARAQAEVERVRQYHAMIDQLAAAFVVAVDEAARFDAWVQDGVAIVARCRDALARRDVLLTLDDKLDGKLQRVFQTADKGHLLQQQIETRLSAARVVVGDGRRPDASAGTLAEWMATWSTRLIDRARADGPTVAPVAEAET